MPDTLVHATACGNEVRCVAAVTTDLVDEAARRHGTSPGVSAALGRSLTGGLLLSTMLKDVERLTLIFDCTGPIGRITVDADTDGNVRGYVQNPQVDLPLNERNKLDVAGLVGGGMLYVIREGGYYEMGVYQDAYRGSVPIVSGEIGEDLAFYLGKSEQIPSAVSLGVFVVPDGNPGFRVHSAGGFMAQILPGASEEIIGSLEAAIGDFPSVTSVIRDGAGPRDILDRVMGQYDVSILEQKPIRFRCTCSYKRALKIISAIDRAEIESMLSEDGGAELVCHYCSSRYRVSAETLSNVLEKDG